MKVNIFIALSLSLCWYGVFFLLLCLCKVICVWATVLKAQIRPSDKKGEAITSCLLCSHLNPYRTIQTSPSFCLCLSAWLWGISPLSFSLTPLFVPLIPCHPPCVSLLSSIHHTASADLYLLIRGKMAKGQMRLIKLIGKINVGLYDVFFCQARPCCMYLSECVCWSAVWTITMIRQEI